MYVYSIYVHTGWFFYTIYHARTHMYFQDAGFKRMLSLQAEHRKDLLNPSGSYEVANVAKMIRGHLRHLL